MDNKINWRIPLRYGGLGGVGMFYFSVIGMIEVFGTRYMVGEAFTFGHVILYGGAIIAGYLAARDIKSNALLQSVLAGLVAGFIAAIPTTILVLISNAVDLRSVFVNITPGLNEFVTAGRGMGGLVFFMLIAAVAGGLTAAYTHLDDRFRKPLNSGLIWVAGFSTFSELVSQILRNLFGRVAANLLYDKVSLRVIPAIVIFLIAAGIIYYRASRPKEEKAEVVEGEKGDAKTEKLRTRVIQFVAVGLIMIIAPWLIGGFLSQVLFEIGRFTLLGLGLNIVVGYAGLLDLGYVAFFAFGAYIMGILTTTSSLNVGNGFFNFWTALPICVIASVAFGALLGFPVLRMRGDYLAIVTLGFGEIIRILALSDWLAPIIGGAQGILKIPNPVFFGYEMDKPETMYYLVLLGSLLAGFISVRLRDSRLGRQWMAMREDEDVAEAMGINLVQTKLMAFAIGAGFSGLAGAIFSARLSNIFPHSFNLLISINALSLIIVGGLANIPGVLVGAVILIGMPELLREFQEYRYLIYGILLIVMMLNKPEGFLPAEVIRREFHADKDEPDTIGAEA